MPGRKIGKAAVLYAAPAYSFAGASGHQLGLAADTGPGPGSYMNTSFSSSIKGGAIQTSHRKALQPSDTPSPLEYSPRLNHLRSSSAFSIGAAKRDAGRANASHGPTATTYDPAPALDKTKFNSPPVSIPSGRAIDNELARTPAPCDYNPRSQVELRKSSPSFRMGGRYSPQHSADLLNATGPGSYTADLSPVRRSSSAYSFGRSMQRAQEGRKAVPGPGEYDISAAMRHVRPSTSATTISELSRPAPGDSSGGPGPGAYQPRIEAASTHRSSFIGAPMSSGARDGSMGKADITPAPADYDLSRSLRQSHKNAAAFTIGSGRKADRAAGRMPGVGTYDITKADGQLHSSSASVGMPHSVRGAGDHSDRTPAPNQYDPQDMSPRKGGVSMKWRYRTKGESQPGPTDYVSPYLPRGRSAPAFTMRVKPRRGGTMGDALATPGPGAYDVGAATIGVYDLQY